MSRRKRDAVAATPTRIALRCRSPVSARARQLELLLREGGYAVDQEGAAALVLWVDPSDLGCPTGPTVLDVVDVSDAAAVSADAVRNAGLLLVGSEAERGYWAASGLEAAIAVVPFAPPVLRRAESAPFRTLHIVQGPAPSEATLAAVQQAAAWAAGRGIASGVLDGSGAAGLQGMRLGGAPLPLGPGAVVLDARSTAAEGLGTPSALLAAMGHGAPVLCAGECALLPRLEAEGAGVAAADVRSGLDRIAALPPSGLQAMADAAVAFATGWTDSARARAALLGALARAAARVRRRTEAWMRPQPGIDHAGRVLVISDEALNLVDIRVQLPFDTLHRRGVIDGYAVLRHGDFAFSTDEVTPGMRFDAVWVHRNVDAGVQLLLRVLDRKFAYDVDDNLLVSPAYRTAFPAETIEAAQALLASCTVLSCATPALLGLLQKRTSERLMPKAVVTPNLAHGEPPAPKPGAAEAVIWASSDKPALTGSRPEVERAVRDFCLAHRLRLVCVGAEPPPVLAESGLEIEHIGLLSYQAYLTRLRGLAPGILVCPLETGGDAETQDFVDGKSDVKVMEARRAGLVGVFSRARPYLESELDPPILCDNTYDSWLHGLGQALLLCRQPPPPAPWPPSRAAELLGPLPWAEALRRVRLHQPVSVLEIQDAVRFVREQQATLFGTREAFDEAYYLGRHDDVRLAVEQGVVRSGYDHYVNSGYVEGRAARPRPSAKGASDTWWSLLLRTVGRLEREVTAEAAEIEALRERVALRRVERPRPAAPPRPAEPEPVAPPSPERAHPSIDLHWRPPGQSIDQPCPVCDTPGPHPVLLVADGERLARCRRCESCFYEHRVVYDYEREKDADVLEQLYLEQNASIYHQTRFLFAIEGVDSVLDVGCGFGYPVDVAAKVLGWRAVGVDPSFYAREGARLLQADIRKEYLEADSALGDPFGLVMASEVIEHVPDPYAFLALLRRWLRPGGTLVLTTPDSAALEPGIGPGSLIGILALKVHLILFTKESLATALRRAGFRHVQVDAAHDNLVAYASDRPLRFRQDAAERHVQAYKKYLEHLVDTAEPGTALWNGGAGRLFTLLASDADLPTLHALFARIAAAWRERFGIDVARPRLPKLIPESAFIAGDPSTKPASLAALYPLNLAGVLFNRAVLEYRTPGRTPEAVLAHARPAYLYAVQTRRVLQAEDMIDLDLKLTAWRARQLIVDCLAELAPEVEGELLRGLAEQSPGDLHDRVDLPEDAMVARITPWFSRTVQADRFDDAKRVEPWMRDLDLLCDANSAEPDRMFRGLFTVGVLRLIADGAADAALEAFERMAIEARKLIDDPRHGALARDFLRVAEEHVRMAAARLEPAA